MAIKADYKEIADAGLLEATNILEDTAGLKKDIAKYTKAKESAEDLGYYLMLTKEKRDTYKEIYNKTLKNASVFERMGIDAPGFDDWYSGKEKFNIGGVDLNLQDINAMIVADKINRGELDFPKILGGYKKGAK